MCDTENNQKIGLTLILMNVICEVPINIINKISKLVKHVNA